MLTTEKPSHLRKLGWCLALLGISQLRAQNTPAPPKKAASVLQLTAERETLEMELQRREGLGIDPEDESLRSLEKRLLTVEEREHEAKQFRPSSSKSWSNETNMGSIPVFFLTDRSLTKGRYRDVVRISGLEFGIAKTTLGYPRAVRFDKIAGARALPQHTQPAAPLVTSTTTQSAFLAAINRAAGGPGVSTKRYVLLFVHGFDTSFDDAVNGAARLASTLQIPVVPVVYSWTSSGAITGYWHDEDAARTALKPLVEFLKPLLTQKSYHVVIVSHSLGARLVSSALSELGRNHVEVPGLSNVVFAAGDVSIDEFDGEWPDMRSIKGARFSFYVSDCDWPLWLSRHLHARQRLGDALPRVHAPLGGDTLDVSTVDSLSQSFGHSYLVGSSRIGLDIGQWIETGDTPAMRNLVQKTGVDGTYFLFP